MYKHKQLLLLQLSCHRTLHDGRTCFRLYKWYQRRINCDLFLCRVTHYSICLSVCCCACNVHISFIRTPSTSLCRKCNAHIASSVCQCTFCAKKRNETGEAKEYNREMQPVCGRNHMIKMLWCFFSVVYLLPAASATVFHAIDKAIQLLFSSKLNKHFIVNHNWNAKLSK